MMRHRKGRDLIADPRAENWPTSIHGVRFMGRSSEMKSSSRLPFWRTLSQRRERCSCSTEMGVTPTRRRSLKSRPSGSSPSVSPLSVEQNVLTVSKMGSLQGVQAAGIAHHPIPSLPDVVVEPHAERVLQRFRLPVRIQPEFHDHRGDEAGCNGIQRAPREERIQFDVQFERVRLQVDFLCGDSNGDVAGVGTPLG